MTDWTKPVLMTWPASREEVAAALACAAERIDRDHPAHSTDEDEPECIECLNADEQAWGIFRAVQTLGLEDTQGGSDVRALAFDRIAQR